MTCRFDHLITALAAIDAVSFDDLPFCNQEATHEVTIVRAEVKGFALELHAQVCAEHELITGMAEGLQSTRRIRQPQTT